MHMGDLHTSCLGSPPEVPWKSLRICSFLHHFGCNNYDGICPERCEQVRRSGTGFKAIRKRLLLEHDWVLFLHVWGNWVLVTRYERSWKAWDISLTDCVGPYNFMLYLHSLCICVLLCLGFDIGWARRHRDASSRQRLCRNYEAAFLLKSNDLLSYHNYSDVHSARRSSWQVRDRGRRPCWDKRQWLGTWKSFFYKRDTQTILDHKCDEKLRSSLHSSCSYTCLWQTHNVHFGRGWYLWNDQRATAAFNCAFEAYSKNKELAHVGLFLYRIFVHHGSTSTPYNYILFRLTHNMPKNESF